MSIDGKYEILNIVDVIYTERMKIIQESISNFKSKNNIDVENFLKNNAVNFCRLKQSITYLLYDKNRIRQYFINKKMNLNDDFDIVILDTFLGDSRLLKLNKNSLYVALPNIDSKPYCLFSEIAGVREAAPPSKMFYLYTKNRIDPKDFVQYLLYEAKI